MHEHPAALAVLDDRRGRPDRARVARHQRQGRLHGHHGHHPPPLSASKQLYLLLSIAAATARRHTGNTQIRARNYRPGTDSMSGVLVVEPIP